MKNKTKAGQTYMICSMENGYTIEHLLGDTWVARSWAEVIEILTEIGAPDYKENK